MNEDEKENGNRTKREIKLDRQVQRDQIEEEEYLYGEEEECLRM